MACGVRLVNKVWSDAPASGPCGICWMHPAPQAAAAAPCLIRCQVQVCPGNVSQPKWGCVCPWCACKAEGWQARVHVMCVQPRFAGWYTSIPTSKLDEPPPWCFAVQRAVQQVVVYNGMLFARISMLVCVDTAQCCHWQYRQQGQFANRNFKSRPQTTHGHMSE